LTFALGRILNRFSKDQYTIDDSLMRTLGQFMGTTMQVVSVLVVMGVATPFFLTALLPMAFLYRHIQKYYLQSSRELKRLESITRSPVYAQFSETLSGLSTIRTYGRENDFNAANNGKLDLNQCAFYALQSANRW
jgi:ABC-type multidrug transport system fused ATPase/permease subunit